MFSLYSIGIMEVLAICSDLNWRTGCWSVERKKISLILELDTNQLEE